METYQLLTAIVLIVGLIAISSNVNWKNELTDLTNLFKSQDHEDH